MISIELSKRFTKRVREARREEDYPDGLLFPVNVSQNIDGMDAM
jgi:hypothetical protein